MIAVASHLGHAINHETVLVWGRPLESKYYSTPERGFGCIFQNLSYCEANISSVGNMQSKNEIMELFVIPKVVEEFMFKYMPKISHAQALYWWKAQTVAYVMRLNNASVKSIVDLRKSRTTHLLFGSKKSECFLVFIKKNDNEIFY